MRNMFILPTNLPSNLFKLAGDLYLELELCHDPKRNQNVYITSDDKPKDGEWVLNTSNNKIFKHDDSNPDAYTLSKWKKIIMTSDQYLIKEGVQAIPVEVMQWIVINPRCGGVEVVEEIVEDTSKDYIVGVGQPCVTLYKIIIPDDKTIEAVEEVQTYEEVAKQYSQYNEQINKAIQGAVKFGIDWHMKRSYEKVEVDKLLNRLLENSMCSVAGDELIKEFMRNNNLKK